MGLFGPELRYARISTKRQRIASMIATRNFLLRLTQPKETPRMSRDIRGEARALLRHYPSEDVLRPVLEEGFEE
jgi:hypothetical protein